MTRSEHAFALTDDGCQIFGDRPPHAARPWTHLGRSKAQRDAGIPTGLNHPRPYRELGSTSRGTIETYRSPKTAAPKVAAA